MFSVVLFQFLVLYTMDPLYERHLNEHILSLVFMFPDKGLSHECEDRMYNYIFKFWRLLFKGTMRMRDRRVFLKILKMVLLTDVTQYEQFFVSFI